MNDAGLLQIPHLGVRSMDLPMDLCCEIRRFFLVNCGSLLFFAFFLLLLLLLEDDFLFFLTITSPSILCTLAYAFHCFRCHNAEPGSQVSSLAPYPTQRTLYSSLPFLSLRCLTIPPTGYSWLLLLICPRATVASGFSEWASGREVGS